MTVTEILIRATIGFVVLYILCRLLNKKLIAQMTFFDFVAGITIGSIVASSMIMKDVPIWISMIGLITFCFYTFVSSIIALKSMRGRKILEDEETYLIQNGQILEEGLKKVRMTMDSLLVNLRKKGFFYVDQVETAIMETDGTVTVLAKPAFLPAMQKDVLNIQASRGLAQAFIIDGKILHQSLKILGKDEGWIRDLLIEYNIPKLHDVFFAQIDELGTIYIDLRDDYIPKQFN
ncbi:DUF421 domain-containing protein [Halalkalibacter akibai]|uniref:DUF421 domain-containing protein n=1 Tax=Halalkalibacter akibai (strain ATCC 43226 / DSM 21942 / CIP 109018 / JCM 9157 / 1139) TaxID=1236973 RepID=W4QXU4_HALA3|nr:DUF421 domain-containing protein [Halalkalibacter akibai]GAE36742.1 hypothetical protein JCM9157_3959 [Halalkalibacter akibai JCM 9157]